MGSTQSAPYRRIAAVIPQCHEPYWEESRKWPDKVQDRDQLIQAIISILSSNGQLNLEEYNFKLHFSRRDSDGEDRFLATLVAIKEGKIEAKIEPELDGETRMEAFKAFKKHVQITLDRIFETVPNIAAERRGDATVDRSVAEPASARSSLETLMETHDMPPPYDAENRGSGKEAS